MTAIGFLGAGQMATALARGWLAAGLTKRESCRASDPSASARSTFTGATECEAVESNAAIAAASDILVLAVKPQNVPAVFAELRGKILQRHLVVSIVAGLTLDRLAEAFRPTDRLVRVMPNTPCVVGASACGYATGPGVTTADLATVDRLLNAVGRAFRLPEALLDAVTGLSGSGPAFVYVIIEALSDGGVRMGLPRPVATALAAQTVFGAAKMVLETELHPGELKDQVTSPGGTTIAGLQRLERGAVRAALIDAVEAATLRARELGAG